MSIVLNKIKRPKHFQTVLWLFSFFYFRSMSTIHVRCLLQQCTKATLRLPDDSIITVCRSSRSFWPELILHSNRLIVEWSPLSLFWKTPKETTSINWVRTAMLVHDDHSTSLLSANEIATVRLCESDDGSGMKTIADLPGDLLIIPQATLGGRLNGHRFQYHHNINKDVGLELFDRLVANLRDLCRQNTNHVVHAGTYGIRQIYSCETNGPSMHLIEY